MADVKEFLYNFFAQRHFDVMPADVRARYDDYRSKSDFNGHMKAWSQKYIDAKGNSQDLPELTENADFETLYKWLQEIFQSMNENRKDFKDIKPVNDFLDKWYGTDKIFNSDKVTDEAKSVIGEKPSQQGQKPQEKTLLRVLQDNRAKLTAILEEHVLTEGLTYDDFVKGLEDKKYEKEDKYRKNLRRVLNHIASYQDYGQSYWPIDDTVDFQGLSTSDLFQIDTSKLGEFKTNYMNLLSELVSNKLVRDNFTKYDSRGTVTKQLNNALSDTAYDDKESKDYVPPKVAEAKNTIDKIKDWKDKTYEQYFRKFFSSRGSRKYFSPYAYEIVKAIDKEKIKPTEGIDGILNKKDALIKRFSDKSPTAKKHFEWFEKAMTDVKARVPDSYKNAFKDGKKLKKVVSQVIVKAVQEGRIEEAKTTLELLSVCKYGFTTSKTMDAMKNEHITIFSDRGLSWNQNSKGGMLVVSSALDKTLEFGLKAIGRSAAILRNIHQQRLSKFRGKQGDLAPYIQEKKNEKQAIVQEQKRNDQQLLDANNKTLASLAKGKGASKRNITATNINKLKTDLGNRKSTLDAVQSEYDAEDKDLKSKKQILDAKQQEFVKQQQLYDASVQDRQILEAKEKYDAAPAQIKSKESVRTALYDELNSLTPGTPEEKAKTKQILDIEKEIYDLQQYIAANDSIFKNPDQEMITRLDSAKTIRTNYGAAEKEYKKAEKDHKTAQGLLNGTKTYLGIVKKEYDSLNNDITKYEDLITENTTLNENLHGANNYDVQLQNWDQNNVDNYRYLMGYWDTLQTFSKTHSFALATLKMQERNLQLEKRTINVAGKPKEVTQTMAQWQIQSALDGYSYAA